MPAARIMRHLQKHTRLTLKGNPMLKRVLSLILALLMLLTATAVFAREEKLNVITLNFPAFDFTRQVAGDLANVTLLLPPGMDAHSFEPTPRDMIALLEADLLVYNGGIGDAWVKQLLASLGDNAPRTLVMMDLVDTVAEELVEGMEDVPHAHDHDDDDHENHDGHDHEHEDERELDEHVWTSPLNAILIAQAIAETLMEMDPANETAYEENFVAYEAKLRDLDARFRELVNSAQRRTIVLGDRFPMRYFTNEYGLSYSAAFPGCSAATEPSAKTIAFLMESIKKESIPVVFHIELSNQKASKLIAEETGAKSLLLHSAHNVSQQDFDSGITYLDIMEENLTNLKEALN